MGFGKWALRIGGNLLVLVLLGACSSELSTSESTQISTGSIGGGTQDLSGLSVESISLLELDPSEPDLTLTADGGTGKYLIALMPLGNQSSLGTIELSMQGQSVGSLAAKAPPAALTAVEEGSSGDEFHQYLMEMGNYFTDSGLVQPVTSSRLGALAKNQAVGDSKSFRVLSSISSISTYQTINAVLRKKTDGILLYVDKNANSLVDDAHVQALVDNFEQVALPVERDLFGQESDVNNDGLITILMTPVLNQMATSGGLVTGFFFPGDLYSQNSSNPASNEQEIFYTLVPDPQGSFGPVVSVDFAINNILPGVLAHEYQHMTSFQQHVFLHAGSTEVSWLNEALSHFSEDITGFGQENPSRVNLAFTNPAKSQLIPPSSPGLAERGMGYLFIRYLYEQSSDGPNFIGKLLDTSLTGTDNILQAFAGTDPDFDELNDFFTHWMLTMALSGSGTTEDPRHNYDPRTPHPLTGNWVGTCLRCDTQDGRGTILNGPGIAAPTDFPLSADVETSAIQYLLVDPAGDNVDLKLSNGSSALAAIAKLK